MDRAPSVEGLLREATPQALGAVARRFEDFAACEDAVQEALIEAAEQWPLRGLPENPVGWLIHVASRRMADRLRSDSARRAREELAARRELPEVAAPAGDDTLVLMFTCCHPALSGPSATALTLRAVAGLTTAQIAAAFLVPTTTMAQRISRAKRSIEAAGARFAMPDAAEVPARLRAVEHVLYLTFNEGYLASDGALLLRAELSGEAIRLTRMLHAAMSPEPEVTGLLALMLLTEARRPARAGAHGELIPLAEQDRTLWRREQIAEGEALLRQALSRGAVGEYQLQAAIAAAHGRAASAQDTDWGEIAGLYGLLESLADNPMVSLNRAIAVAMAQGPAAGLALLEPLTERLGDHHRLHAARAHLLETAGETDAAIVAYEAAAARTASVPEQRYLLTQAARLGSADDSRRG